MSPRTPKGQTRERIYQFVRKRLLEGLPPTVREVRDAFNFRAIETAAVYRREGGAAVPAPPGAFR